MDLNGPPSPSQFFSFDYPDSQATALLGINNAGQVAGFFHLRGEPANHGFLATRVEEEKRRCDPSPVPRGGAAAMLVNFKDRLGGFGKGNHFPAESAASC